MTIGAVQQRGAILVTGASSGIGEACARQLAAAGFQVFAGVRKAEDAERLQREIAGVTPVTIDVTDGGSIAAAVQTVSGAVGERGLAGLVNNAGIVFFAPLEHQPLDDFPRQIDVNLTGQVAVTQAFLPLLRAARGRIVNMSSTGGKLAFPLLGAYGAAKFGLEAVSDTLRRELRPWGMHVVVIEPDTIATPIWDKGVETGEALSGAMSPEAQEAYGGLFAFGRGASAAANSDGISPDAVAKAVEHALTARKPKTRYLVGKAARQRALLARVMPDRALDAAFARQTGWR